MEESKSRKKRRRANFTDKEILTLIEEVKKRKHVIMGKLDKTVTVQAKAIAWEEITKCVNLVNDNHCNPNDLRVKFKDLKYMVKKKAGQQVLEINQTGKNKMCSCISSPLYDVVMSHISSTNVQPS